MGSLAYLVKRARLFKEKPNHSLSAYNVVPSTRTAAETRLCQIIYWTRYTYLYMNAIIAFSNYKLTFTGFSKILQ